MVLLSGVLLQKMTDMMLVNLIFATAMTCYACLISFPENSVVTYFANSLLAGSIAMTQSVFFLISELRVPS